MTNSLFTTGVLTCFLAFFSFNPLKLVKSSWMRVNKEQEQLIIDCISPKKWHPCQQQLMANSSLGSGGVSGEPSTFMMGYGRAHSCADMHCHCVIRTATAMQCFTVLSPASGS